MGIFGKNDPNTVKMYGIRIGPPDPNGWTAEDVASWKRDEDGAPTGEHTGTKCNYVGGLLKKRCGRTAESGNARCSWHVGKLSS